MNAPPKQGRARPSTGLTEFAAKALVPRESVYRVPGGGCPGLMLEVRPGGARLWVVRYQLRGRQSSVGLGPFTTAADPERVVLSVRSARIEGIRVRELLRQGIDPAESKRAAADRARADAIEARERLVAARQAARARREAERTERARQSATLKAVAERWQYAMSSTWTQQHAAQVQQSLVDHVYPVRTDKATLGDTPIDDVCQADVLRVVERLLTSTPERRGRASGPRLETQRRVVQRLEALFAWAHATVGLTDNPVRAARPIITSLRKAARRANPKRHFAAVDGKLLPQLLRAVDSYGGSLVVQTATWVLMRVFTRPSELRLAKWGEFVLDGPEPHWLVPLARMKVRVVGDHEAEPHYVPLAPPVVERLLALRELTGGGPDALVFPQDRRPDRPMSENAYLVLFDAVGFKGRQTAHGVRRIASTALHEHGWPHLAIEAQLAHHEEDAVVAAYNGARYLETRRAMLTWWAQALDELAAGKGWPRVMLPSDRDRLPLHVVRRAAGG